MSESNELERIVCIKEYFKQVNRLSRKIYLLALNAMLMSRRAGGAGTGYARVTKELRAFSEKLDNSMSQMIVVCAQMTSEVSKNVKRRRLTDTFAEALRQAQKRNEGFSLATGQSALHTLSTTKGIERAASLKGVARRLSRLRQLCRQGLNVAVLAKVEAMHVSRHSQILHDIGDEILVFVEQVEELMMAAFNHVDSLDYDNDRVVS